MNIFCIFKLLLKHFVLIVIFGLIMSFSIYLFTRGKPRAYQSSTTIYTGLATGYSLESGSSSKLDYFATNTKFDNFINIIKSRETYKEVVLRLLAKHLHDDSLKITEYRHLDKILPHVVRKVLTDTASVEATYFRLNEYAIRNDSNLIYKLLNSENDFYSLKKISTLTVKRMQSSDLIEISYQTIQPNVCKQTVEIINEVMFRKYSFLQSSQTGTVVKYFETQVSNAAFKLNTSEQKLLEFRGHNRIINYDEQTKSIAEQKILLDNLYNEEVMSYTSALAAKKSIEEKLNTKNTVALQSDNMLEKRKRLADIATKISMFEIYNPGETEEIYRLKQEAAKLKGELGDEINNISESARTNEGLTTKSLLDEWLSNTVKYEEGKAKLEVIKKQQADFLEKYDQFSPLGSEMSKIEREISIAEKEYLSYIENLNAAKLKQQNLEVSPTLTVLDTPNLPLEPLKSKRRILIILGFLLGCFLISSLIIFLDYIDLHVKSPEEAQKVIGIELAGAFPSLITGKHNGVNLHKLEGRLTEMLYQNIEIHLKSTTNEGYDLIILSSMQNEEGKSLIGQHLSGQLNFNSHSTLYITFSNELNNRNFIPGSIKYTSQDFGNKPFSIEKIISDNKLDIKDYKIILLELPALLNYSFPIHLVRNAALSLLVCNANLIWNKANENMLALYKKSAVNPVLSILNGVNLNFLEPLIGDIPRKPNFIRKIGKFIYNFEIAR